MNFSTKSYSAKIAVSLIVLCMVTNTLLAQKRSEEEMKRIQDAKVAIITNRLSLTPEQSVLFWPVYNEYSQKRRSIHRAQRKIISDKQAGGLTDEQMLNNLKEVQELKQKELNLEKEYQDRFLKVISAGQLIELYKAEKTFNDMLIQRLQRHKDGGRN